MFSLPGWMSVSFSVLIMVYFTVLLLCWFFVLSFISCTVLLPDSIQISIEASLVFLFAGFLPD